MSTEQRDTIGGEIEKGAKDVRDSVTSELHRSSADAERARRDADGNVMTPGEKVKSVANEAKERIEAGRDDAKRHIRDNT